MNTNPASAQVQTHGIKLAVSIEEAAHALSVSRRHLYTLLETGELKSFTSRRRRLIRLTELNRYIMEREGEYLAEAISASWRS